MKLQDLHTLLIAGMYLNNKSPEVTTKPAYWGPETQKAYERSFLDIMTEEDFNGDNLTRMRSAKTQPSELDVRYTDRLENLYKTKPSKPKKAKKSKKSKKTSKS